MQGQQGGGDRTLTRRQSVGSLSRISVLTRAMGSIIGYATTNSYGLAHPEFDCGTPKVHSAMEFRERVPPAWIVDIETRSI